MKTELLLITPEIANNLLIKNNMNRRIEERLVREYARQMIAGLWKEETGESIKIACDGSILDGQYRLNAIIKSGVSLNFLVISDLEKEIFNVIDTGKKRSPGDVFHISGVKNPNNLAAGLRRYFTLKRGNVAFGSKVGIANISNAELLSLYNSRPKLWDSILNNVQLWYSHSQRILSMSEIFALYSYFYDINIDDAFTFMESLTNGINLDQNSPIKQMRDKLIFSKSNTKFRLTAEQRTALIYKAWNLFRKKQTQKFLRFNSETEDFPIPI